MNHAIIRSFAATCRRNGISPFMALVKIGENPRFDAFNAGIPPPILGEGAPDATSRHPPCPRNSERRLGPKWTIGGRIVAARRVDV